MVKQSLRLLEKSVYAIMFIFSLSMVLNQVLEEKKLINMGKHAIYSSQIVYEQAEPAIKNSNIISYSELFACMMEAPQYEVEVVVENERVIFKAGRVTSISDVQQMPEADSYECSYTHNDDGVIEKVVYTGR